MVVLVCGASFPAFGYVPGADQILNQLVVCNGTAKALEIKQKAVYYDKRIKDGSAEFSETVKYKFPDKFRSVVTGSKVKKITVLNNGKTLAILDNKLTAIDENGFDHYMDLLLYKNKDMLRRILEKHDIDTSQTEFDRYGDKIVLVIGKMGRDGITYPSLSFEKKTLLPLRWVLGSNGKTESGQGGALMEILYLDWKKTGSIQYPSRIEFYNNHTLVRKLRIDSVNPDFKNDDSLFDIDTVKRKNVSKPVQSNIRPRKNLRTDSQKTIESLDKIIGKNRLAY